MATATKPLGLDIDYDYEVDDIEQNIFDILTAYQPPDSSITPQQAASHINDLFPYNRSGDDEEKEGGTDFLFTFWELLFRIAPQLDYHQEPMQRFIALISALHNLPEIILEDDGIRRAGREMWGYPASCDGLRAWQDRVYFGITLEERLHQIGPSPDPYTEPNRQWRNLNGLLAQFMKQGVFDDHRMALQTISNALEVVIRKRKKLDLEQRKIIIHHSVPAAIVWFTICADHIFNACQQRECSDRVTRGNIWEGEQGFSTARWKLWRSRLVELSSHPDAMEETKEGCRAAVDVMDAVEIL